MPTYLEIAVNVPQVSGVFHYHLPPEIEGNVGVGHLVVVPFGRQTVQGVVLREINQPAVPKTRPVIEIIDQQAVLTPAQLQLAILMSERTLAPVSRCISLMVPTGLSQQVDTTYALTETGLLPQPGTKLTPLQKRLLKLLQRRGALRGRQIDRAIPRIQWRPSADQLARRGMLTRQSVLPAPTVRPRVMRTAQLACPPEVALSQVDHLGRPGSGAFVRRQAIIRFLVDEPGPVDVAWVYAESGGNASDLRWLSERGLVRLGESHVWRDPLGDLEYIPSTPPTLTPDQQAIWEPIQKAIQAVGSGVPVAPFLLHGVTGSGKTEIYLRAVAETLAAGRQAFVLVPEIALTPQAVRRFIARFPGQIGLIHSKLSSGERYDTWRRTRAGEIAVVVGPRSALFTPLPRMGLIVVDESHDDSYFQFETPPHYHAREVAVDYARLTGSVCLLGSATPDVVSHFRAAGGQWQYLRLPARILAHREAIRRKTEKLGLKSHFRPLHDQAETQDLPPVQVVDMRQELKAGNRSIFSRVLQESLDQVLQAQQQAILFLNRRGTSTYIFCRDCGFALNCPRCELPLTYHRAHLALTCHHCGYKRQMPTICPQCKSKRIRQYGTGTESVESELRKMFPQVRTLRWDWETTRKKGAHDVILSHFSAHQADVLIGTQMLAKGLDLPLVTLVGAILADVGLKLPDYRAGERTFQVLAQVAGRAGRSPLGGEVVLQTFQPDHYVIKTAAHHDYESFYNQELDYRRQLGYPPFAQLVRLEFRHANPKKAEETAFSLASAIHHWIKSEARRATEVVGPAPCYYHRLEGQYRWHIILRGPDPASLLHERPLDGWRVAVNPPSLL